MKPQIEEEPVTGSSDICLRQAWTRFCRQWAQRPVRPHLSSSKPLTSRAFEKKKHSAAIQVCTPVSHSHNRSCTELPWILRKQPLEDTTGGTVFTGLARSGPLSLYNIPPLSPLNMSGGINKTVPLGGDTTVYHKHCSSKSSQLI